MEAGTPPRATAVSGPRPAAPDARNPWHRAYVNPGCVDCRRAWLTADRRRFLSPRLSKKAAPPASALEQRGRRRAASSAIRLRRPRMTESAWDSVESFPHVSDRTVYPGPVPRLARAPPRRRVPTAYFLPEADDIHGVPGCIGQRVGRGTGTRARGTGLSIGLPLPSNRSDEDRAMHGADAASPTPSCTTRFRVEISQPPVMMQATGDCEGTRCSGNPMVMPDKERRPSSSVGAAAAREGLGGQQWPWSEFLAGDASVGMELCCPAGFSEPGLSSLTG
ncbi:hypothetical protein SETIT_3G097800v2 [Setaria italica]|uniref:Uncharacterized protein n=1 Tax=Setaria italica TaxID=4555 RepID=A0A368QD82_SETIT|nr:hypothetical protein SETIT_3G097800v2 [Setaria italica]